MASIVINKLGPINHCELEIDDFMILTGPQSAGKSTIAKSVFFFKNVRNILMQQLRKRTLLSEDTMNLSMKNRLIRELRSNFMQIFGSTWCMDRDMSLRYEYTSGISISIYLKDDPISPNYIWIAFSEELTAFLEQLDMDFHVEDMVANTEFQNPIKKQINDVFADYREVIYIPAGRSMITLLSTQLNYIYSMMDDSQRRSMDYCTQNYLEKILQLKPFFSLSMEELMEEQIRSTARKINIPLMKEVISLIKQILQGEYRNVGGEERLQVSRERYVKINFASSGQQEAVWILNVLFYYLLMGTKTYFIIEEPESHLYPASQKLITEFIAIVKNAGNQVMVTTHSPYILGTMNNLLYANKISKQVEKTKLGRIIGENRWIDIEELAAYYVSEGVCKSCLDAEFEAIENEIIDGASEDIDKDYNEMISLRY